MMTKLTQDEVSQKIRSTALLVSLQLGDYNPKKIDKEESKKVCQIHNISDPNSTVMQVSKNTLPTAGVISEITTLDGRIRALVNKFTAPFARGIGLLAAVKFFELNNAVNILFDERKLLVARLADEYTILRDQAERTLTTAFKLEDYPPVADVISRFTQKLDCFKIGDPKDSKFDVISEIADQIQDAMNETLASKFESVTPYIRELLLKHLVHQSAVLQNPDHKLSETTFTNVLDAADQAKHLNLMEDDQIRNAIFAIDQFPRVTKDQVKDDDHLRSKILSLCNSVIELLDGTIPAPAIHKPRASTGKPKKSKSKAKAPALIDTPQEPTDEQIDAVADLADLVPPTPAKDEETDDSIDADAMFAKLGW
jgi:hypothetical protein